MAVLSVQDDALLKGADATFRARLALEQEIRMLCEDTESLTTHYYGAAADELDALVAEWEMDANGLNSTLQTFEANLRTFQSSLTQGEHDNSAAFAAVAARLGGYSSPASPSSEHQSTETVAERIAKRLGG